MMGEKATDSSWILELSKWHKNFGRRNDCCMRECESTNCIVSSSSGSGSGSRGSRGSSDSSGSRESRGSSSGRDIRATTDSTPTTTGKSNVATSSLLAPRTSAKALPNGNDSNEVAIETTRTRGLQRRQTTGGCNFRVSITKSLAIGAVAVTLLILAQQILKFPVQAAGETQGSRVGIASFAPVINLGNDLADFNVNSQDLGIESDSKTSACGCSENTSLDKSDDIDDIDDIDDDGDEQQAIDGNSISSLRDVEQQQDSNDLQRLLSGSAGGERSFQRVSRGYLNVRKPTDPRLYKVLNIVSDPTIDIVPTTQSDLNKVSIYSDEFASSASSSNGIYNNNSNKNRLELRGNSTQHDQLIPLAGPSNSDEAITIDKIKGIDLSLEGIMAKKEERGSTGKRGSGREGRSSSDEVECITNKFDRTIARKLNTNSLSKPIIKSDGTYDNPFPTWRAVGPMDLMKFVVTESDESGIPKNKEELDEELPILKPNFEVDPSKKKKFRVTWIGHATTLIQVDGLNILTDPIFSNRASPIQLFGPKRYRDPACTVSELPRIDIVLISHNHYDHLDTNSVERLNDRFGDNCRWIVPLGIGEFLQSMSVNNYVELDWWQKDCFSVDDLLDESKAPINKSSILSPHNTTAKSATDSSNSKDTKETTARSQHQENPTRNRNSRTKTRELDIYMTPNQHWSRRGVNDVCKTLWGSYVIVSSDGSTFFFAGDTGYCPAFREIRSVFGPMKGAAIPIGAYQPRWFMKYSHVDPHEAVQMHSDLECAKSIAIHHSTFALANEYYKEPPQLLREIMTGLNDTVKTPFTTLKHGETTDF